MTCQICENQKPRWHAGLVGADLELTRCRMMPVEHGVLCGVEFWLVFSTERRERMAF